MNKVLMSLTFGAFVLTGTSFAQTPPPAAEPASTTAPAAPAAPAAAPATVKPAHHHDSLHKAMHELRLAKDNLLKLGSSHDAAGHRAKAVADIDEALKELKEVTE